MRTRPLLFQGVNACLKTSEWLDKLPYGWLYLKYREVLGNLQVGSSTRALRKGKPIPPVAEPRLWIGRWAAAVTWGRKATDLRSHRFPSAMGKDRRAAEEANRFFYVPETK